MSEQPTVTDEVHYWTEEQTQALFRQPAVREAIRRGEEQIARGESVTMTELREELWLPMPQHSAARSAHGSEPDDV